MVKELITIDPDRVGIESGLTQKGEKGKIFTMLNYAICEVNGKQYKVLPNTPLKIDYQGEGGKDVEAKVMLLVKDEKLQLGKPYLKEKLILKFVENGKSAKIRVSKYHAKANYRRTVGIRPKYTSVIYSVKN